MHRIIKILATTVLAVSVFSCIQDDSEPGPCPEHIRIVPEWINTTPHASGLAAVRIIPMAGVEIDTLSTAAGVVVDLPGGTYGIVGNEEAANVTVNGRTISVTAGVGGMLPDPGALAGGAVNVTLKNHNEPVSEELVVPVPMRQQTRQLVVEVVFLNNGFPSVTALSGKMGRIASSRDINDGFPTLSGATMPDAITYGSVDFTFSAVNEDGEDFYRGSRQLLGVDGRGPQQFDLSVTAGGDSKTFTIDLSRAMEGFHTNHVNIPWVIILEVDLSARLELTIINWSLGEISDIIAE